MLMLAIRDAIVGIAINCLSAVLLSLLGQLHSHIKDKYCLLYICLQDTGGMLNSFWIETNKYIFLTKESQSLTVWPVARVTLSGIRTQQGSGVVLKVRGYAHSIRLGPLSYRTPLD